MNETDLHCIQLLLSLQTGAMVQLGKIASPLSGKLERDLGQARATIDLLESLRNKTEGHLSPDEKALLDRALYELRMNYVDELERGSEPKTKTDIKSEPPAADNENI
jgi:hypothetical protein